MSAAMISDTNDGKNWSTIDKQDLADLLDAGGSIEEAAKFLCRAGTPGEVARKAVELGLLTRTEQKYSIELFTAGGSREAMLAYGENLDQARALYRLLRGEYPGAVVMLSDGGRILASSDQPDTMP